MFFSFSKASGVLLAGRLFAAFVGAMLVQASGKPRMADFVDIDLCRYHNHHRSSCHTRLSWPSHYSIPEEWITPVPLTKPCGGAASGKYKLGLTATKSSVETIAGGDLPPPQTPALPCQSIPPPPPPSPPLLSSHTLSHQGLSPLGQGKPPASLGINSLICVSVGRSGDSEDSSRFPAR